MRKIIALFMAAVVMFGTTACGNTGNDDVTVSDDSKQDTDVQSPAEDTKFTLTYPESMKTQGYEDLVLDEMPTRIACTATSPVLTLHAMGASLAAIPTSSATEHLFQENSDLVALKSLMSDDFNIEDVVALNPDLVILATSYKDSHGATLEELGIAVYYQAAGHGVSYETVKEESICLIDAFAVGEESKEKAVVLKQRFEDVEATCAELSKNNTGKSVMVIQAGGVGYVYGQTSGGTLGSMMKMFGFDNIADSTAASSMFEIDYETALVNQPDLLVVVGSGDADATKDMMGEIIEANPTYWNAMTAVANDQVLYLGIEYIAVYGIGYLDALDSLADEIAAFDAE